MALELKDARPQPDRVHRYTSTMLNHQVALVIDNGSYQCRAGWASTSEPALKFKNLIAKPRKERGKKDSEPPATPPIQIGNDITNIEALKTQFDRNVVTHFEAQEQVFDYTFSHLGINTDGSVQHPIIMTEAFVNPNYCRNLMSELLFECYGVPSVAYGVDGLFSFYHNKLGKTGIVINCGYHTTHIIPIIKGKVISAHSRRINVGGFQIINFLHRLLQLKYPAHLNAITPSRVEELLIDHCQIALHYQEEIKRWTDAEHYDANVRKIQLPYVQPVVNPNLSLEAQKERKKEMAKRLIEINARKREEKLAEDEEQLNQLLGLQDLLDEGDTDEFYRCIQSSGVKDEDDLLRQINKLNVRIEKVKQKIAAAASADNDLSQNSIDEKVIITNASKIQPPCDPVQFNLWLEDFKKKRAEIVEARFIRKQRRLDMAKRRTVAAQERMRLISQLAKKEKANDDFGMRDEDWDVYKTISREGNDSDSDAENEKIMEIDEILREYDPQFGGSIGSESTEIGLSEAHQLHLGIERLRAPELLFQPFMMGNIEAGIAETVEYVLKQFTPEEQLALANNVFLTGGCSNFPGLKARLSRELLEMRPFQTPHKVNIASNPSLDAWYGARTFARDNQISKYLITKKNYNEMGGEYLKEHYAGNKFCNTPIVFTYNSGTSNDTGIKEEI